MNERIFTELYKKAFGHFPCPAGEPELEKLAELIVRECICQCDDENSQKYIMAHFGMKESDWS